MTMDSVREQIDQLEERYKALVEDVQQQLKELESRADELRERIGEQVPDRDELVQRAKDVNTDIRERVGLLAEQVRDRASDAVDAVTEAGGKLLGREGGAELDENATKQELYAEATRLEIVGRSSMSKAELAAAIKKAG